MRSRATPRTARWLLTAVALVSCTTPARQLAPTLASYADLRQATVPVANPDGMVAVPGALWVKTDDGRVVRIDPATNTVTREITTDQVSDPSAYCQGIGTDGTSVWACATRDDATSVVRIDPATGQASHRVAVAKTFDQLALPATARGLWVLTGDGSALQVVAFGSIWLTSGDDGQVIRLQLPA